MSMSSVRRFFRKYHGCYRYFIYLAFVMCLATTAIWAWNYSRSTSSLSSRMQQFSSHFNVEVAEVPLATCPICPDPPVLEIPAPDSNLPLINCTINNEEVIECRRDRGEVFMPVSFINRFFDVYGAIRKQGRQDYYDFQYSYGKIHPIQPVYHPGGVFLNFDRYFVEGRSSIKCVTASDGVPLASQWDPAGYYYAISVAQYGLSHHAKAILEGNPQTQGMWRGPPESLYILNALNRLIKKSKLKIYVIQMLSSGQQDTSIWMITDSSMSVSLVIETLENGNSRPVVAFSAQEYLTSPGPVLTLNTREQAVCFNLKMDGPGGITVRIKTKEGKFGYIHYTHDDNYIVRDGNHAVYGMGQRNFGKWMHQARDLNVDWQKALGGVKHNSPTLFLEIVDITLHGKGFLDNLTISSTAHNDHLIHAADWLVNNQDSMGGWPTSVGMKTGDSISLKPGWYSAMGQGQVMSTLVRAYNLTGHRHYLNVAVRGLHLYELGSEEGGVRARFLGQLDWYEEYPTIPTSTFVLNGFIFSMLGLYDVMMTADGEGQRLAEKLWKSGLKSLKIMLGMYDTGTGTLYDLRHVINHEQPNRARWDYHTTHIALIQEMAIIDNDPIFYTTAERWIAYFNGKKSRHN